MIFYFSGTGNTEWAAKAIAQATHEELIFIPEAIKNKTKITLKENERIGFCFPVHGWRPPFIVRNFIHNLLIDNTEGHYCFALCTAGDNIGETIDILTKDLQGIGIHLNSAFSLIMPESYVGLPFMDVDKPQKEHYKKEKAKNDLSEYIQNIVDYKDGIFKLTIGRWPKINSRFIGSFFINQLINDKPFHVNSSRCVKCGICKNSCPIDNIIGGLDKEPTWKHDGQCLTCFACYHHCPQHAIEFGHRTKNKGQYWFSKNK